MNAKVSIIIPCYNGEAVVNRAITSVFDQDYGNVELIVVNDGSTDNSAEVICAWRDRFAEKGWTLKYVYQENRGLGGAVNTGLKHVTGDYLSLLDADDRFLPNSIWLRATYLDTHPDCAGVKSNGWYVRDNDRKLFVTSEEEKKITDVFTALICGKTNNWAGTYLIRTKILFEFYPEREIYASRFGQNLQLIMPVAYKRKFGYIDQPLMEYFIHTGSLSHVAKDQYETSVTNANGYRDIYMHMLALVVKDPVEYGQLKKIIDECYYRSGFQLAAYHGNHSDMKKQYLELKNLDCITLDDRMFYLKHRIPASAMVIRGLKMGRACTHRLFYRVLSVKRSIHYKYITKVKYTIPGVIDRLETSKQIAENSRLSIVRFGDGELDQVISKSDIGFQKYDELLGERLREIIISDPEENILVCIPNVFNSLDHMRKDPRRYWEKWLQQNRRRLSELLPSKKYGDSLVSRLYLPWTDRRYEFEIVSNLKKAWQCKNVMVVEGAKTRWGVGNDLLSNAKSVQRIICPSTNAFSKYEKILDACLAYQNRVDLFILALGPTATILAYDLAKQNCRALDLGHFDLQYEYLIRQSDTRGKIAGKYNNEIQDTIIEQCDDVEYVMTIVENISDEI